MFLTPGRCAPNHPLTDVLLDWWRFLSLRLALSTVASSWLIRRRRGRSHCLRRDVHLHWRGRTFHQHQPALSVAAISAAVISAAVRRHLGRVRSRQWTNRCQTLHNLSGESMAARRELIRRQRGRLHWRRRRVLLSWSGRGLRRWRGRYG